MHLHPETAGSIMSRVRSLEEDVEILRHALDGEDLASSDRQYLSRCFDLLKMEVDALREYIEALRR
ncbi:MAG TPA: hypothetical protein VMS98_06490 [Thermoanaerobaculia bacterium]|nr:hypothetical protein [Thermoanaerobaculia bacterium]